MTTPQGSVNGRRRWRGKTIGWLVAIVVFGIGVAFGAEELIGDVKLREFVQKAAVALVFATVFGGWVKLLFDDLAEERKQARAEVERERIDRAAKAEQLQARRASEAQFFRNVLADLKTVHDQVERARLLIEAYRSAVTFRDEMRGLVDARVALLNVDRALRAEKDSLLVEVGTDLTQPVSRMADFLRDVVLEFQDHYKDIADAQRIYEALAKARERNWTGNEEPDAVDLPDNPAWDQITDLPVYDWFIRDPAAPHGRPARYNEHFLEPLDQASERLRALLYRLQSTPTAS